MTGNYEIDDQRISSVPGRRFFPFRELMSFRRDKESAFLLSCGRDSKEPVDVHLEIVRSDLFRIRYSADTVIPGEGSPMIAHIPEEGISPKVAESKDSIWILTGVLNLEIQRKPWRLSVRDGSGLLLYSQSIDDTFRVPPESIIIPSGTYEDPDGCRGVLESFHLETGEKIFGLGEKFGSLDRRGGKFVGWNVDPHGTTTTDWAYKNIPFFWSTRGWGIFIVTGAKIIYEMGSRSFISGTFIIEDPAMDFFFIYGPSPAEILRKYSEITGFAPVPPRWSFGLWMSRCMYRNRREVEEVARELRQREIPCDVIHIDPLWLRGRKLIPGDSCCDLVWDEEAFPEPVEMIRALRQMGFRLSLWENPYVHENFDMFVEGAGKGFFPLGSDGNPARIPDRPGCTTVDFFNPRAARWYVDKHRPLLEMGVSVFKTDYGEEPPADGTYHDGKSGSAIHNLYPLLYNKAVFEITREVNGHGLVWARSATAGSQRYPVHWSGDPRCTFPAMASVLRAGLSLGMSGIPFWSHDIGGFLGEPTPELYIRWAQFGLFSSHSRCHGTTPREPWHFGEEAEKIFKVYARLRYRLIPYLYSCAHVASRTGMPLVRAMALEFPEDPVCSSLETQYMLGRELLVAPVLDGTGKKRVYLPEGMWVDFWSGHVHKGPRFIERDTPLDILPLYLREDAILPLGRPVQHTGEEGPDEFTLRIFLCKKASFRLEDGPEHREFVAERFAPPGGDEEIRLDLSGPQAFYRVIFHALGEPEDVTLDGVSLARGPGVQGWGGAPMGLVVRFSTPGGRSTLCLK